MMIIPVARAIVLYLKHFPRPGLTCQRTKSSKASRCSREHSFQRSSSTEPGAKDIQRSHRNSSH